MSWKETGPGRYERPLDGIELLMKLMRDMFAAMNVENWCLNFHTRVQLSGGTEAEIEAGLRAAWVRTRYYHPLVATLLEGANHVYQVPDKAALEDWEAESFFVHKDQTVPDWLHSVSAIRYSSVHWFPSTSELVIRMHHWQQDGMGGLHLLDRYFEYFAEGDDTTPQFGDEWKRLAPAQAEAAPLPISTDPKVQEEAKKLFAGHFAAKPSIGLDFQQAPPKGTAVTRLSFPAPTLEHLQAACKKAGFSVTSAVQAAIIVATQDMPAETMKDRDFTTMAFFNHRPYVQAPYNDTKAWATGCWMVATPFTVPKADFVSHAHSVHKIFHQPLGKGQWVDWDAYGSYLKEFTDLLQTPLPEGVTPPPSTQPQLSSLGRMDNRVQHSYRGKRTVDIEHVELNINMMLPYFTVYQWSWKDAFNISVNYNDGYFDKAFVDKWLAHAVHVMFKGLGLDVPKAS